MKKKIDIEKLVQWALREELPKGKPVSASAWDLVFRYGQLGARIQSSGSPDAFGFVPGAPHEDAERVSAALEKLETQIPIASAADARGLFGDLALIAEPFIETLMTSTFNSQAIVISKAIGGTRPKWEFEQPTPYQMKTEFRDALGALRDRPLVHGTDENGDVIFLLPNRGRAAQRDGMYDYASAPRSPLNWGDPDLLSIGHARAEYLAWHGALVLLATWLAGTLTEYEPTLPAVRPMPWITGQVPASRVLSDGLPDGLLTVKLPLQPKRKAPGPALESDIERKSRLYLSQKRNGRQVANPDVSGVS